MWLHDEPGHQPRVRSRPPVRIRLTHAGAGGGGSSAGERSRKASREEKLESRCCRACSNLKASEYASRISSHTPATKITFTESIQHTQTQTHTYNTHINTHKPSTPRTQAHQTNETHQRKRHR